MVTMVSRRSFFETASALGAAHLLPSSVGRVRVHGHCLTHGEYVDFLRVPA